MRRVITVLVVLAVVIGAVVVGAVLLADYLARPFAMDECVVTVDGRTTELNPEQAENAALVSAMSVQRGMPARAASIAIATAYQETDLRNLDYGDRDSLGLFQQRPSQGWGTAEQLMDPYYATTQFYDHLEKVDGYLTMPITEAAQAVQRSADGSLYAQHEPRARALASSLTGYSEAAFSCDLVEVPQEHYPRALSAELAMAFGELDTDTAASQVEVAVDPQDRPLGWAVAQWALAYAKRYGVTAVSYAGMTWSAAESEAGWTPTSTESGSDQVSSQPNPNATVIISF